MKHCLFLFLAVLVPMLSFGAEKEVRLQGAGALLAGTLLTPDTSSAPPLAVLFASGSGAQDRDEEVASHRPFRLLADSLAAAGYASLRLDDRGTGLSTGSYDTASASDLLSDLQAAVKFLRDTFPDTPVGIIGHSMGGSHAIWMASRGLADFIVTLAAPACRGDSLVISQSRLLAVALTGRWDAGPHQKKIMEVASSPLPAHLARPMLYVALSEAYGDAASLPAVAERISAEIETLLVPWYRDMLRYDPADDIARVRCPWLALNGTYDTQVPVGSLDTIASLSPGASVLPLPGHNHLFQTVGQAPALSADTSAPADITPGLPLHYASLGQSPSSLTLRAILDFLSSVR